MLRKRMLVLPIGCLSILSIICVIAFGSLAQGWMVNFFNQDMASNIQRLASIIQRDAPNPTGREIHQYLHENNLVKQSERITIIDVQGKVLGDSGLSYAVMNDLDNHASRPEVEIALSGHLGMNVRHSSTLNTSLIYVARPIEYKNFKGVIRMSMPLAHAEGFIDQLQLLLSVLLVSILIIMSVLAVIIYVHVQKQMGVSQHRLEEDVIERTKEIELLQRLATMLAACNTVAEAQQVVEDVIPRILGDINGAVALIRSSRNQLNVKLDWGGEWAGAHSYSPDECWALRKGKFHVSHDDFASLPCSHMDNVSDHHTLCIPLIAHGNTIGIMHFDTGSKEFDQEHRQLAFTVAEHLGLALANLNLQEKLREQAIRDPLTGLHNRRFLEETMPQEMMRAKRHNHPLSVLMLDMDHFKLFNDNFGHDAGDYVLKSLATLLNDSLRSEDCICRIGGEEVAVLLPNTDAIAAGVAAKRLCDGVQKMDLSFRGQSLGKLTLSIGIASNADASSSEDMLKQADNALYEAKERGRNQYRYANPANHNLEPTRLAQIEADKTKQSGKVIRAKDKKSGVSENTDSNDVVTQLKPAED